MTYDEYIASLPDLKKIEKEGYVELTDLCVATENQQKLFDFFKTVKDFSADDDYMTTLNYVIEYLDKNKIHFIMSLDWKASINDLKWRINSSLKDNYGLTIDLPKQEDYEERATVSFDNVFEDFDKPLRNKGIQMGFIDTQSDEYVIFLHKIADKQKVEKSVEKIGYKYHEK
ncbi:hypothetical protein HYN56_04510 [Flavobacterium crocinum]|uniref:DUF6630 domain-containing protein n=2 Tax=Flavobacterium crocinum TaxID=2183896 RepID=A0A2S1YTB2_9FLAO|nr:hypothetical protein HYN56_04510 [Flavobacterium crocinum]